MGYTDEPRPCVAYGSRALFHGWADLEKPNIEDGKQVGCWKQTVAIIEYLGGTVRMVSPCRVRFLDGEEKFSKYEWGAADG